MQQKSIVKLKKINIHGPLRETLGESIYLDVNNAAQVLAAVKICYPSISNDYIVLVDGEEQLFLTLDESTKIDLVPSIGGSGFVVGGAIALVSAVLSGASIGVALVSAAKYVFTGLVISGIQSLLSPGAKPRLVNNITQSQVSINSIQASLQGVEIPVNNISSGLRLQTVGASGASPYTPPVPFDSPGSGFSGIISPIQEGGSIPIIYGDCIINGNVICNPLSIFRSTTINGNNLSPLTWTRGYEQWSQVLHYIGDGASEVIECYVDGIPIEEINESSIDLNLVNGTQGYAPITSIDYWHSKELGIELNDSSITNDVSGLGINFSRLYPGLGYNFALTTFHTSRLYWIEDLTNEIKGWSGITGQRFGYELKGLSDNGTITDFTKEEYVQGLSINSLIFTVDSQPPGNTDQRIVITPSDARTLVANRPVSDSDRYIAIFSGVVASNTISIPGKIRFYSIKLRFQQWARGKHSVIVKLKVFATNQTIYSHTITSKTDTIYFPRGVQNTTYRNGTYYLELTSTAVRPYIEKVIRKIPTATKFEQTVWDSSGSIKYDVQLYKYRQSNFPQLYQPNNKYPGQWYYVDQSFESEYDIDLRGITFYVANYLNAHFRGEVVVYANGKLQHGAGSTFYISKGNVQSVHKIEMPLSLGIVKVPPGKRYATIRILISSGAGNSGIIWLGRFDKYKYKKVNGIQYHNFSKGVRAEGNITDSTVYTLSEVFMLIKGFVYIPKDTEVEDRYNDNADILYGGSDDETSASLDNTSLQDRGLYIDVQGATVDETVVVDPNPPPIPTPILTNFDEDSQITIKRLPEDWSNDSDRRFSNLNAVNLSLRLSKNFKSYDKGLVVKTQLNAKEINNPQVFQWRVRGRTIRIPSNSTVVSQEVTASNGVKFIDRRLTFTEGIWDGSFKETLEVCSDPAWVLYDLLIDNEYGLGEYIDESQIDKFSFYAASIYNNGLVKGAARYTFDGVISGEQSTDQVINNICVNMRASLNWSQGLLRLAQDRPTLPSHILTQANTVNGIFEYESSGSTTRKSVVRIHYLETKVNATAQTYIYEDRPLINELGYKMIDIDYIGQLKNPDRLLHIAKWYLYTQKYETEIIKFRVPLEGLTLTPGEVVQVSNKDRVGIRAAGRLREGSTKDILVVDDEIDPELFLSNPGSGTTWDSIEGLMDSWIGPFDTWTSGATPILFDSLSGNIDDWIGLWDNLTSQNIESLMNITVALPNGLDTVQVKSISGNRLKLVRPLEVDPPLWTLWVISNELMKPSLWRILTVSEESDGTEFGVTALQYNPSKYSYIEEDTPLEVPVVSIYPYQKLIPEKVSLSLNETRTILTANWDPVLAASSYLIGYRISTELSQGQELTVEVTGTTYSWNYNLDPGNIWFIRIWSIFSDGSRSPISRNAEIAL